MPIKKVVVLILTFVFIAGCGLREPIKKHMHHTPDYTTLQKQITQYLDGQTGVYGLYFIDLKSHHQFGYNASVPFHAASTFKVPMNLYLYQQLAKGDTDIKLSDQITFKPKHLEGGTGILIQKQPGGSFTVRDLARYSIVFSDNIATNMLLERLGKKNVKDFMRQLGALVVDDDKNTTCPADLATYLVATLAFSQSKNPNANLLLQDLFNVQDKERLPAPLPTTIKIANKVGTWPPSHTYHDMAYIAHPRRPYILVVTSKETPGYAQALEVIHHISKTVYDFQTTLP